MEKVIDTTDKILDYGAGVGHTSLYLGSRGYNVTAIELDNSFTKQMLMWRTYKYHLGNNIKFAFDEQKDSFDVIIVTDVLEYLHHPLRFIVQLAKLLDNADSRIILSNNYNSNQLFGSAIEKNEWIRDAFDDIMKSLAFEKVDHKQMEEYDISVWKPSLFKKPKEVTE